MEFGGNRFKTRTLEKLIDRWCQEPKTSPKIIIIIGDDYVSKNRIEREEMITQWIAYDSTLKDKTSCYDNSTLKDSGQIWIYSNPMIRIQIQDEKISEKESEFSPQLKL